MAETTTDYWQQKANVIANCHSDNRTANVIQNMLITKAYAELYVGNPRVFKWAGMAAFASDMVGAGILAGKTYDIAGDTYRRMFTDDRWATRDQRRLNITDLDNMLIAGNKAVFRDIYWQHLVYRDAGVGELLRLLRTGAVVKPDMLIEGWGKISEGDKTNSQGFIWQGNALLLKYEQSVTLQRVYNAYARLAANLSYYMISPLPAQIARFRDTFPEGSIGDLQKRWAWIEGELLPHWKELDASSMLAKVRLFLTASEPKWRICFVL